MKRSLMPAGVFVLCILYILRCSADIEVNLVLFAGGDYLGLNTFSALISVAANRRVVEAATMGAILFFVTFSVAGVRLIFKRS